ncbi:anti-repressor SinI family protein [Priestia megaterium]
MMMKDSEKNLPEEWMNLVREAREAMDSNVSKEQFKQFLEEKAENNNKAKTLDNEYLMFLLSRNLFTI